MGLIGGLSGCVLALWGLKSVTKLMPDASTLQANVDARILTFTAAISLLSSLLLGIAPVLAANKVHPSPTLKGEAAHSVASRSLRLTLAKTLTILQVAVSLVLLILAGLLVRTLANLENQDLGFDREHVLFAHVDPRLAGYHETKLGNLYRRLLERLNSLPGVRSASFALYSPMSGFTMSINIGVPGSPPGPEEEMRASIDLVGPRYFETVGTAVVVGREIGSEDTPRSPRVAVVNEAFGHYFFPNQNPLGRTFILPPNETCEIVGVVRDAKYSELREPPPRMMYLAAVQAQDSQARGIVWPRNEAGDIVIRTSINPADIADAVHHAITEVDKNLPLAELTTLRQQVNDSLGRERLIADLSSLFGLLALVLSCVGLYGVLSYSISRRTTEFGIRMAVGARPRDISMMVMRDTLVLVGSGIVVGMTGAMTWARLLSSELFALAPADF
jgi:predicted permease